MIRLVALDIDGTLLDNSNRLSEANAAAVREALSRGTQVVLATSRWFHLARLTAESLGLTTPLICHNGALVKRPEDGQELLHLRLDQDFALQVATLGDQGRYMMFTTIDDVTCMRPQGRGPRRLPRDMRVSNYHAQAVAQAAPTAILIFGEQAVEEVWGAFYERFGETVNFSRNHSLAFPHYLSLTHAEADKGRSLALVCRELGVDPAEAMAMGDAEADAAMFDVVGYGIAMGNAPEAVRQAASDVAPQNDEDGVAWAVRKYVLDT
jgi:Cof subfamily protein (haloacid dehalogenase superfamily)